MVRTLIVISTLVVHIFAQPAANPNQPPPGGGQQKPAEPPKKKSMEEALKNKKEIPGFFTLYQDTTSGKLFMLVKKDQLNKEYIHFVHGLNGQLNAGVFKGSYGGAKVIKLNRYFNRIEFEVQNNALYFDPENPLHRSADANVSTAILAASYVVSEKDGSALIGVDNVFLSEALYQITRGFVPGVRTKTPLRSADSQRRGPNMFRLKTILRTRTLSFNMFIQTQPLQTGVRMLGLQTQGLSM